MEAIILPWWKLPIYIAIATLGIVAIRISIKFDMNSWLKARTESKTLKERRKVSRRCLHMWTLYDDSPYSRCDKCQILISTSILVASCATQDPKPIMSCQVSGMRIRPGKNELVTSNYIGIKA